MEEQVTFLYREGATKSQEDEAKMILEALDFAYPGHPWGVRVYDGGFFIRHLDFPKNWGMNCKTNKIYSASSLKKQVIMMAGEWLERANVFRGKNLHGEVKGNVEGVPEKDQPIRTQEFVAVANTELRDTSPKVIKQIEKDLDDRFSKA